MGQLAAGNTLTFLRLVSAAWADDRRTDADLLGEFAAGRDERAFTTLVGRHAGLVWSVCRRTLGNTPDAEDAFQSTFLALARKAPRVGTGESVAGWLYRVAQRRAADLRAAIARRKRAEGGATADVPGPAPRPAIDEAELQAVLDEELARLPEKYRAPILMCVLEGRTYRAAGVALGCSRTAVLRRLEAGQEALRRRLVRRGVGLGVGGVAGLLAVAGAAAARPPVRLMVETVAAAATVTGTPHPAAGVAPAGPVFGGSQCVGYGMAVVVAGGLVVGGALYVAHAGPPDPPAPLAAPAEVVAPRPAADRFGDPLPEGALARIGTTRFGPQGGAATDTAWADDNRSLVTADGRGGVVIWDVAAGTVRRRVEGPAKARLVAVSADGQRLVAAGESEVWCWDVTPDGPRLRWKWKADGEAVPGSAMLTALAFAPDGKSLACGDATADCVRLLDPDRGTVLDSLGGTPLSPLCFVAGGKTLAAVLRTTDRGKHQLAVWDLPGGRRRTFDYPDGHEIADFTPAPGGGRLVWSGRDRVVRVLDTRTGREERTWPAACDRSVLAFLPDGKAVAEFGYDRGVYRDPASGRELRRAAVSPVPWVAMAQTNGCGKRQSPDGRYLSVAGAGSVAAFEVETGREITPAGRMHAGVRSLAFSPDGRRLLSASGITDVRVWDAASGEPVRQLASDTPALVWDAAWAGPGGKVTAWAAPLSPGTRPSITPLRWDTAVGRADRVAEVPWPPPTGPIRGSHDGRWLARADGSEVLLIDPTGREVGRFRGQETIRGVASSADGRTLLAWYARANSVDLWDTAAGRPHGVGTLALDPGPCLRADISGDGRWVAAVGTDRAAPAGSRYQVAVWEVASGVLARRLPPSAQLPVCIALSPDGRLLAAGYHDGGVSVWDLATDREARRFAGHRATVQSLAFSPDGRRLASGSDDCTGLVWDAAGLCGPTRDDRPPAELVAALASADPVAASQAGHALVEKPEAATRLLAEHLTPAAPPDAARVTRWIAELDAGMYATRVSARTELLRHAAAVAPAVRKAIENGPSAEAAPVLADVLRRAESARSPGRLAASRGVAVLEQIDDAAARRVLARLAGQTADEWLAGEAGAALKRAGGRPGVTP